MLLGRVGAGEGGGKRDALKTHTGWKMRNETTVKRQKYIDDLLLGVPKISPM